MDRIDAGRHAIAHQCADPECKGTYLVTDPLRDGSRAYRAVCPVDPTHDLERRGAVINPFRVSPEVRKLTEKYSGKGKSYDNH